MEAKGGGRDLRKMDNMHGNNGRNLNKQIPDFEEIIKDIDEAIQYDPGVSNSKRDIFNKLLNGIGNSSEQGVDGVFGNITKHTGSDFKEFKENTPILETEVAKDSNFTFKLGWESRNMEKKSNNKGPTRSKSKDKKKVHSQDSQTKPKLEEVRVGQASAKRGSWTRLRERPTHQMEEDSLRSMGEPKRKHVGMEDECLES